MEEIEMYNYIYHEQIYVDYSFYISHWKGLKISSISSYLQGNSKLKRQEIYSQEVRNSTNVN